MTSAVPRHGPSRKMSGLPLMSCDNDMTAWLKDK